jgi:hypothetical protein
MSPQQQRLTTATFVTGRSWSAFYDYATIALLQQQRAPLTNRRSGPETNDLSATSSLDANGDALVTGGRRAAAAIGNTPQSNILKSSAPRFFTKNRFSPALFDKPILQLANRACNKRHLHKHSGRDESVHKTRDGWATILRLISNRFRLPAHEQKSRCRLYLIELQPLQSFAFVAPIVPLVHLAPSVYPAESRNASCSILRPVRQAVES